MKKNFYTLVFLSFFAAHAQNHDIKASVEKSILGIQTGLFGFWGYYETKLLPQVSIRTEIGLELGLREGVFTNDKLVFALIPNLVLEPRWYYSMGRRVRKGRGITNNSGFFWGFKTRYYPDWFVISNEKNISVVESMDFIPKIGYRKVWHDHLSFESGFGIGRSLSFSNDSWDTTAELTFRIGYNF